MTQLIPPLELPDCFHEQRLKIIGGSDIAALGGVKAFGSKHSIYARLTGIDLPFEPTNRMVVGQYLESGIAKMFTAAMAGWYGEAVTVVTHDQFGNPLFFCRPDYPWWGSHPDALVFRPGESSPYAVAQFKKVEVDQAHLWGESGTDQAPEGYLLQVHHEMGSITGCTIEVGYLVALIGSDLRIYPVERNEHILKSIANVGEAFMANHVIPKIPPPVDESSDCTDLLTALRPPDKGLEIEGTPELDALAAELEEVDEGLKQAKAGYNLVKNKIVAALNAAGGASIVTGHFKDCNYRLNYQQNKPGRKTDNEAIVAELNPPQEVIDRHTTTTPGAFVLRKTFTREK